MVVKYKTLGKIFYQENERRYKQTYESRFESPSTIHLPLTIQTNHKKEYPLFVMMLPEHFIQIEYIEKSIQKWNFFQQTSTNQVFEKDYIEKLLKEEIQQSNEIEGESTTKEELEDVLQNMGDHTKRFHYIVNKYDALLTNGLQPLDAPEDIRQIYDELLTNGIDEADLPDGKLFRKELVSIYNRSGNGKEVHRGVFPEKEIYKKIKELLFFLNTSNVSFYVKLAVVHYYIGYIHPFYDGNGRLTRYISSSLLATKKNKFLALKLSKILKENIITYDKMFVVTTSDENKGDFTPFFNYFMTVLVEACKEITNEIKYYQDKNEEMHLFIAEQFDMANEIEKQVLFVVYQAEMFGNLIEAKDVARRVGKSPQMTRKYLNQLINKNYIERFGEKNSKFFHVTDNFRENLIEFIHKKTFHSIQE